MIAVVLMLSWTLFMMWVFLVGQPEGIRNTFEPLVEVVNWWRASVWLMLTAIAVQMGRRSK